jgi:hypothetical protein
MKKNEYSTANGTTGLMIPQLFHNYRLLWSRWQRYLDCSSLVPALCAIDLSRAADSHVHKSMITFAAGKQQKLYRHFMAGFVGQPWLVLARAL